MESITGESLYQSSNVSPSEEYLEVEEDKSEAGIPLERFKSRIEDDYEIQDTLGRGGFGKVYKVNNCLLCSYSIVKNKMNSGIQKLW